MKQKRSLLGVLLLCTSALHGMDMVNHRKMIVNLNESTQKNLNGEQPSKKQKSKKHSLGLLCCCCPRLSKKTQIKNSNEVLNETKPLEDKRQSQIEDGTSINTGKLWQLDFLSEEKFISLEDIFHPFTNPEVLKIWLISNGEQAETIEAGYPILNYGLSPNKDQVVTNCMPSSEKQLSVIQIWDIEAQRCMQQIEIPYQVIGVNLRDNNNTLWYSWQYQDKTKLTEETCKYDLRTKKITKQLDGIYDTISQDSTIGARAILGETIMITDLETEEIISNKIPCSIPNLMLLSPDNKTLVFNGWKYCNLISFWNVDTGDFIQQLNAGTDLSSPTAIQLNPANSDELIASISNYPGPDEIKIWKVKEGKLIYTRKFDKQANTAATDGTQIAANVGDQTVVFPYPKNSEEELDS